MIEAFKRFGPQDHEDGITLKSMKRTLEEEGERLTDEELKILFESVDVDNDGLIGIKDFLLMMMAK